VKRSDGRILTTHAGSLPRPPDLLALMGAGADPPTLAARVRSAVAEAVARQRAIGLDVITDGEMSKPSFITYVTERLSGFTPSREPGRLPWAGSKEVTAFPEFYEPSLRQGPNASAPRYACTGPITYVGQAHVQTDIANLKAALAGLETRDSRSGPSGGMGGPWPGPPSHLEAFLPAIAPSNVEGRQANAYYKTDEEYLFAIADAMHEEYQAIVDAGLVLQIDDPRLVTYYIASPTSTVEECRRWAAVRVEALNHALRGLPRERVRFHTCYSINMGPRVHDMQLTDIVDVILKVRAGAYSFEAANPRHEHEWRVWEDVTLPEDAVLIPGVITQSTVLVEHPELVAQRLERFASVVGRERVIAGADCGFASFAGSTEIHPTVVWAKLQSLVDGARLASQRLWS
jgi:5-methyltetrahydropteroyltriglutamate--homocysteine methyltransferase